MSEPTGAALDKAIWREKFEKLLIVSGIDMGAKLWVLTNNADCFKNIKVSKIWEVQSFSENIIW